MLTNKRLTALIIPTLNAECKDIKSILSAISMQSLQPDFKLLLDSSSTDNTVAIGQENGFEIHMVKQGTFDHAATRKWGISLVKDRADIVIFMTQDALLNNVDSFKNLIENFDDKNIAVAYGRQLARKKASPIEAFSRLKNYPKTSNTLSLKDKDTLGMKVAFCSDAFSAYNIHLITTYNAFPDRSIVGEDYITTARMLINGYSVRYEALATVEHSHDYTIKQEFQRCFDIGVFHDEYTELLAQFGRTEKVGSQFVRAELSYLFTHKPLYIPISLVHTLSKFLGYKLGKLYHYLPRFINRACSMHPFYF